jgi:hypothetical protein
VAVLLSAEVQVGAVRVAYDEGAPPSEADRVARALDRAVRALPPFTGSTALQPSARICSTIDEFTSRTGLPATAAAGVVEQQIVLPPARVTSRLEDLDEVVRHELAHLAILQGLDRSLPRWLVEGFAARLAAESGAVRPDWKGARCTERLVALDGALLNRDPAARAAAYRQSLALANALQAAASSDQALWSALKPGPTRLSSRVLGAKTVAELVRAATGCDP